MVQLLPPLFAFSLTPDEAVGLGYMVGFEFSQSTHHETSNLVDSFPNNEVFCCSPRFVGYAHRNNFYYGSG